MRKTVQIPQTGRAHCSTCNEMGATRLRMQVGHRRRCKPADSASVQPASSRRKPADASRRPHHQQVTFASDAFGMPIGIPAAVAMSGVAEIPALVRSRAKPLLVLAFAAVLVIAVLAVL